MPLIALRMLLNIHDTRTNSRASKATILEALSNHHCDNCDSYVTIFKKIPLFTSASRGVPTKLANPVSLTYLFIRLHLSVVPKKPLLYVNALNPCNHLRFKKEDAPSVCRASVQKGKVPKNALANGLWLGEVPEVLSKLSFVERHPKLGSRKMILHVIAFESPVSKVYSVLPPPHDELDEVLAIMFTGPTLPTKEEMEHTPLLVRHRNVMDSLRWLCLNHYDYSDVELSEANMSTYLDGKAPVAVVYKDRSGNKVPEGMSVFNNDEVDGTTEGPCPVVVHGLIGEYLKTKSINEQKTMAT
ncbi:hypothetical protein ARMGADRAFT_1022969 [Armillaria gallica]|uniref:DUF6570 domain-containing protein n=1 Tax=Armillaria gallica TaxID=47427 RepID=A0A2H3EAV7_ARMGA|nr:hypothetical protein ARMGADRAFT_1022969 [Armillaria gallica]